MRRHACLVLLGAAALAAPAPLLAAAPARAEGVPDHCLHTLDALARGDGQGAATIMFGVDQATEGRQRLTKLLESIGQISKHRRLLVREQLPDDTTGGVSRQIERWRYDFGIIGYAGCLLTPGATPDRYQVAVQFSLKYDLVVSGLKPPTGGDSGGGDSGGGGTGGGGNGGGNGGNGNGGGGEGGQGEHL